MRLDRWPVLPGCRAWLERRESARGRSAWPGAGDRSPAPPRDQGAERRERARPLAALRGPAPRGGSVSEDLGTHGRRKEGQGGITLLRSGRGHRVTGV